MTFCPSTPPRPTMLLRPALAALVALSLGGAGCATAQEAASPETAPVENARVRPGSTAGDSLRLAVGESAVREGETVAFGSLVEDSRCPPGTQCVWAGRLQVRLTVSGEPVLLTLPAIRDDEAEMAERGGVQVVLVGLEGSAETPEVVLVTRPSNV